NYDVVRSQCLGAGAAEFLHYAHLETAGRFEQGAEYWRGGAPVVPVLPGNDESLDLRRLLRNQRHEGRGRTKETLHDRDYSGQRAIIGLMRLVSLLLALCTIASTRPYPEAERARRVGRFRQDFAASVDAFQKAATRPNSTPSVRDLTNGALAV